MWGLSRDPLSAESCPQREDFTEGRQKAVTTFYRGLPIIPGCGCQNDPEGRCRFSWAVINGYTDIAKCQSKRLYRGSAASQNDQDHSDQVPRPVGGLWVQVLDDPIFEGVGSHAAG